MRSFKTFRIQQASSFFEALGLRSLIVFLFSSSLALNFNALASFVLPHLKAFLVESTEPEALAI